jgi:hypothetical protein
VALSLKRLRISPESFEIEKSNDKNRPYVATKIACREGSGHENEMYDKMQAGPPLKISASVHNYNKAKKAVINSFYTMSHGRKQAYGKTNSPNPFIPNEHVRKVVKRFLNKTAIPDFIDAFFDLIRDALGSLSHISNEDRRTAVKYLRSFPVINGLALAIITGRAGTTRGTASKFTEPIRYAFRLHVSW